MTNLNNAAPVDVVIRANKALMKWYNQCKLKEFKGVGGATDAED